MTLAQLKTALEGMNDDAFVGKVAYRAFPAKAAPDLPFICILETETDNFKADSKVYFKRQHVFIELYSASKDVASEDLIEAMLNANELLWDKSEEYIGTEEMYEIIYEVVI